MHWSYFKCNNSTDTLNGYKTPAKEDQVTHSQEPHKYYIWELWFSNIKDVIVYYYFITKIDKWCAKNDW